MDEKRKEARTVYARLPGELAAKLERLAAQSRRSQSAVIRMLIERATLRDLAVVQVEAEAEAAQ